MGDATYCGAFFFVHCLPLNYSWVVVCDQLLIPSVIYTMCMLCMYLSMYTLYIIGYHVGLPRR